MWFPYSHFPWVSFLFVCLLWLLFGLVLFVQGFFLHEILSFVLLILFSWFFFYSVTWIPLFQFVHWHSTLFDYCLDIWDFLRNWYDMLHKLVCLGLAIIFFVSEGIKHKKLSNMFRIFNLPSSNKGGKSFHFTFNYPCKQDTMKPNFSLPLFLCLCLLFTEKSTFPESLVSPGQTALIRIFWSIAWILPPWLNCFFSYRLLFLWGLMSLDLCLEPD